MINIWITSLYGSQPASVVFAIKTATFWSELPVSMGPRLRLLICDCKRACLDPELHLSIGPILYLWFCTFKTATLASELLVSKGPSLRLLICKCKTACLDPEWQLSIGPRPHLGFFSFKTATLARIASLYVSKTSPMVVCMQNNVISIRINSLYGSQR